MDFDADSLQIDPVQDYARNSPSSSLAIRYETIAKSLQPYATKNPKSLTYLIQFNPRTTHNSHSNAIFIWIAKDEHLGYYKTFNCTNYNQIIEKYYEACVFIDTHCTLHKNLYSHYENKLNHLIYSNSNNKDQMPFIGLTQPIPEYLLGYGCSDQGYSKFNGYLDVEARDKPYNSSSSIISSVNIENATGPSDLRSTLIESHFASSNEVGDGYLSDSCTIYSDENWTEDFDDPDTAIGGISKRDVMDYLYPKYVYSYSNNLSCDDIPTSYCKRPILVDNHGSWHYECPKLDKFQNQLVAKIKEWNIYKEERREVMIKKSTLYNQSRVLSINLVKNNLVKNNLVQNTHNGTICATKDNTANQIPNITNATKANSTLNPINEKATNEKATNEKENERKEKTINDNLNVAGFPVVSTVGGENQLQNARKQRRRRSQLTLCEIKCDGRDSSGGYVLRKKNLIGISALEAFDNNWAYEKILRDIKKQSKYEKIKMSQQKEVEKPRNLIGRPPKHETSKGHKIENDILYPIKSRRVKTRKGGYCSNISLDNRIVGKDDDSQVLVNYRNKRVKQSQGHSGSIVGEIFTGFSKSDLNTGHVGNGIPLSNSNDIKSFGTRLPMIKSEPDYEISNSINKIIPDINNSQNGIKVNEIQLNKCDPGYFNYATCESDLIKGDLVSTDGILDTFFKRAHKSRKPPNFYDCYIPLDVNE